MDPDRIRGVAVNVGSQSNYPLGRGPIFDDGSFEYVPITEREVPDVEWPTYADLGYPNDLIKGEEDTVTHFDPEFPEMECGEYYTYADPGNSKTSRLKKLSKGDYLFFYGTLNFKGQRRNEYWINDGWGGYLFGHFKLQWDPIGIDQFRNLPPEDQEPLSNNAHLRRPEQNENLIMILGDPDESDLYDTAIPLSLPERSLGADEKRNAGLDSDGVDINMVWYRGPLELDDKVTEAFLEARQTGECSHLFGPELRLEPGYDDFEAELYPPSDFEDFRNFISERELSDEEELLAAFAYISGGWDVEVPDAVLSASQLGISSLPEFTADENLMGHLTDLFNRLHEKRSWPNSHRANVPRNAGRQRDEGEAYGPYEAEIFIKSITTFASEVNPSFSAFFEGLNDREPFLEALTILKDNVYSFRRLGAFDFLELVVQTLEYDWLAPSQMRYDYVDSNGPRKGLDHVFGVDDFAALDDRDKCQYLTRLIAFACEDREMGLADGIFAVESALCNCQKDHRGAN